MNAFTVFRAHVAQIWGDLMHTPAFVISTVGFPAMFYALFGLPHARTNADAANVILCSFVGFAIIGVTLFQFGVGISAERGRPWERYLRTLPVGIETRFAARVVVALIFGVAAAGLVGALARAFTPITLSPEQWILLAVYTVLGAIPFVLIGISIAYWVPARAALPITNIIYLLSSFAGGFWFPPRALPSFVASISPYLPTRQYGELLWSVVERQDAMHAAVVLCYYTVVFAALAAGGYRRDERTRYA